MQGGDFVFQNGSGGESIYGKKFKDERAGLQMKHDRRGVLSMGNSGKNSNSSQFFLTFDSAPQCDGKHVIFGEVVSGFDIMDAVEKFGTLNGEPSVQITITDCGLFVPLQTAAYGYHYDTPDPGSFTGVSPVFVVRPRVLVLVPSESVIEKFATAMGNFVSIVACISADKTQTANEQGKKISELLGNYAADVVIVATACWNEVQSVIVLPKYWQAEGIELAEVVLVAKPVTALAKIRSESWLGTKRPQWQLDGKF